MPSGVDEDRVLGIIGFDQAFVDQEYRIQCKQEILRHLKAVPITGADLDQQLGCRSPLRIIPILLLVPGALRWLTLPRSPKALNDSKEKYSIVRCENRMMQPNQWGMSHTGQV
jgi:hypothetical protein